MTDALKVAKCDGGCGKTVREDSLKSVQFKMDGQPKNYGYCPTCFAKIEENSQPPASSSPRNIAGR